MSARTRTRTRGRRGVEAVDPPGAQGAQGAPGTTQPDAAAAPTTPDDPPDTCELVLDGELTVLTAAEVHARLLVAARARTCTVDLAGVEEFDTAGLQLLLAARAESRAAGRRLNLRRPSRAVREVLAVLRLDHRMEALR